MTVLEREGHPRQRDWWRYRCDTRNCGDTFWGPPDRSHEHHCEDCRGMPRTLHFTSGGADHGADADRAYHGGQFHQGEW